jgi:bla regulator protein BlaR1
MRMSTRLMMVVALALNGVCFGQSLDKISPAAKAIDDAGRLPHYDVVSIHINNSDTGENEIGPDHNRFSAKNVELRALLQAAYSVDIPDLITGLSGPVASAHFDIDAKVLEEDGTPAKKFTDDDLSAMMIPLLAERFHLKAHLVKKMLPVYELVQAKSGPKMKLKPDGDDDNGSIGFGIDGDNNFITAKQLSMSGLADCLSANILHRVVRDRTGLKGSGDFRLKWSSDEAEIRGGATVSIYTAVEEQLGLKLEPAKELVDTLVIDHVEMPTQN